MVEYQPESLSAIVLSSKMQPPAAVQSRPVEILHPAYDVGMDISLLSLPAFPRLSSPADGLTVYGIARSLVMDACRIITDFAANSQEDYLAFDPEGTRPVPTNDLFLAPGRYFYHLAPQHVTKYPIVMDFSAFKFPKVIPRHWIRPKTAEEDDNLRIAYEGVPSSEMSWRVKTDDESCVVTGYCSTSVCDNAHLVPKDELAWFLVNEMGRFNRSTLGATVNDVSNGVTLRCDVHRLLDSQSFVFYPVGDRKYVTYLVRGTSRDYVELLHGREVSTVPLRVSDEFLYARFAYNIIKLRPRVFGPSVVRVPDDVAVKQLEEELRRTKKKSSKMADDCDFPPTRASSISDPNSVDDIAAGDERYQAKYTTWCPELAELPEVENPPDTSETPYHLETPKMLRLRSQWIKDHPEVWQTVETAPGTTRPDVLGLAAKSLTS
ncbi:hypothetical protein DICSQDRAFT_180282 [Dichomitus squalens LYAD-421 SS1]|uniref:HNH nuclease domain-containing protein n=1 Tax=Dichomitus squalens (strain LYAD-421) TaxID=732165 RepID=R7T0L2_DICSQ|nr:uncharacterized protein DICSQDRAFT_180282 [Dichomitus squalens LYAD-421 SS1]EJF61891.1 hypothetical protein DICSQDRAFT_180282 [Dichomitus squalens LYAD-421 SS1]